MSSLTDRIAAQRKAIAENKVSFIRAYKFKVGKTVVRVLPGVQDKDDFFRLYGAHYIKDPNTDDMIAVVGDSQITYGRPCPVHQAITEFASLAASRGQDEVAKRAKSWLAKPVNVINMQIVDGVDPDNKGKVVQGEFSETAFDQILSVLEDILATDAGAIENGFLISVERQGTGVKDTRYSFSTYPKQPQNPPSQAVLDARIDLQTYVDAKFGQSVTKGLAALSSMLGRDVSEGAIAKALTSTNTTASLPTPAAKPIDLGETTEDLLAIDAEFEEQAPAATEKAKADDFDDILADLDNL